MTLPRTVQLLKAVVTLDDARAVKGAPGEPAKLISKAPFGSLMPCSRIAAASIRMMPEVLGIPFTYTVTRAWPIGRPLIGIEVNELELHVLGGKKIILSVCRLRNWTDGESPGES